MDSYRLSDPLNLNGLDDGEYDEQYGGRSLSGDRNKKKDYKLLIDPLLNQGSQKVYRFEGVNHQDPTPVLVRDPRSRMKRFWAKKDAIELPIPKFKFDQYYVGAILPKEVTFSNLNDNISQSFLRGMVQSFGSVEDVKIYFHPVTKKHLGIGKVVFSSTRAARVCAEKLNQSSKMGMIITAVVDSMGKERQKILEDLTKDRPAKKASFRPPSPPPPSFKDPRSRGPRTPAQPPDHPPPHHRQQSAEQEWGYNDEWEPANNHHAPPGANRGYGGGEQNNAHRKEKQRERGRHHGADNDGAALGGYSRRAGDHRDDRYYHRDERDRDTTGYRDSGPRDSYNRDRGGDRDRDRDRHRHRDRRGGGGEKDSGRYRRDHHHRRNDRYRDYDNGDGDVYDEDPPPAYIPPEPPSPPHPPPAAPVPPEEDEGERNESLESRIASLLGGALPFGSPEREPQSAAEFPPPPPPDDEPPLPNAPAPPPLPAEPPPLPPEPDQFGHLHYPPHMHNGSGPHSSLPPDSSSALQAKDDDCMSLSSVSSGEVEVNPPLDNMNQLWNQPPPAYTPYADTSVMTHDDENNEAFFVSTLEKVLDQLKVIMGKDMSKKVIQNTAFKAFDTWWTQEQQQQQQEKSAPSAPSDAAAKEAPAQEKKAAVDPLTTSLDSLFAKDGPSGQGGLLGLRGGVPKLPSFRRKFVRPPSPPPEGEDDKDDDDEAKLFRGPRTPEDSETSEAEEYQPRRKKANIYSSDEEEEDSDDSEGSEASDADSDDESEEEEEEEDEEESESEASDAESTAAAEKVEKEASPSRKKRKPELEEEESSRLSPVAEDTESNDVNIDSTDDSTKQGDEEDETSKQVSTAEEEEEEDIDIEKDKEHDKSITETEEEDSKMDTLEDTLEDGELDTVAAETQTASVKVNEEDVTNAAMALLQMHDSKPAAPLPTPPQHQTPEEAEKEEYSCTQEHNYFMKGTPKKGRPRKDSSQGVFEEIAGVVLNGADADGGKASDETDSASEGEPELKETLPEWLSRDHQYCQIYLPVPQKPGRKLSGDRSSLAVTNENQAPMGMEIGAETEVTATVAPPKKPGRKRKISDVTNTTQRGNRELAALLPPPKPKRKFQPRSPQEERENTISFLLRGIDSEDLEYLRRKYHDMLTLDDPNTMFINDTHWVDHVPTVIPDSPKPKKSGHSLPKHKTGSARTEGYYKISYADKNLYLSDARGVQAYQKEGDDATVEEQVNARQKKKIEQSREARSESRRIQNVLTSRGEDVSDLLKFNQLKFRKKNLNFSKSGIHDWGLFACEPIAAEEMVIEYVGAVVRQTVADLREKRYEQQGVGSSYMFRIDGDTIIDAYKCGNLARFINHCCNPNCYAKVISVENEKKIVIYSKRDIKMNEEITYDYKFPLEDEKIPCMCGAQGCRGFLN